MPRGRRSTGSRYGKASTEKPSPVIGYDSLTGERLDGTESTLRRCSESQEVASPWRVRMHACGRNIPSTTKALIDEHLVPQTPQQGPRPEPAPPQGAGRCSDRGHRGAERAAEPRCDGSL